MSAADDSSTFHSSAVASKSRKYLGGGEWRIKEEDDAERGERRAGGRERGGQESGGRGDWGKRRERREGREEGGEKGRAGGGEGARPREGDQEGDAHLKSLRKETTIEMESKAKARVYESATGPSSA